MLPSHSSEKGQSVSVAMPAMTQTACSKVESVKPSTVFGRVDGLAIPWWPQRRPKPTWKISRYSLACMGSALQRSVNWACGSTSKPMRFVIQRPAVRPGRTVLDTKLGEADMYQHLSFFRKMLPDTALLDMRTMLHDHVFAKTHAKRSAETQNTGTAGTSQAQQHVSTDSLLEMYAEFLERCAQKTCRVVERRMRCIQLKQELQEAAGTESYPYVIHKNLWHN